MTELDTPAATARTWRSLNEWTSLQDIGLLCLRLALGFELLAHGLQKFGLFGGTSRRARAGLRWCRRRVASRSVTGADIAGPRVVDAWTAEMIAVADKHPNAYIDTSAYTARRPAGARRLPPRPVFAL